MDNDNNLINESYFNPGGTFKVGKGNRKTENEESRATKRRPDYPDIDRDNDRTEPISKAARDKDANHKTDTDKHQTKNNTAKGAKAAARKFGPKRAGRRVAGAVLARLNGSKRDIKEGMMCLKHAYEILREEYNRYN